MSKLIIWPRESYPDDGFAEFDALTSGFSPATAAALIWLSQLSYETEAPAKIVDIATRWGLTLPLPQIVRQSTDLALTSMICGRTTDAAVIAFAGTDPLELRNWLTNFGVGIGPDGGALGFHHAFATILTPLRAFLEALPVGLPLFVTGHSLGGALAVHAAAWLVARPGVAIRGVYTFGMPRPGNAAFARAYDARLGACTYRLVHGFDIVPSVAPAILSFAHVGRRLYAPHLERFAAADLATTVGQHEPGTETLLANLAQAPLAAALNPAARFLAVAQTLTGAATVLTGADMLPPGIRDHLPDRYIHATGGVVRGAAQESRSGS